MKRKRPVDDEAPPPVEKPTVGQLTSHIGNKQVRSEAYGKLRAAKKVRPASQLAVHKAVLRLQGVLSGSCRLKPHNRKPCNRKRRKPGGYSGTKPPPRR